jgi:hypothetical protein
MQAHDQANYPRVDNNSEQSKSQNYGFGGTKHNSFYQAMSSPKYESNFLPDQYKPQPMT